jgi:hypothetical protein
LEYTDEWTYMAYVLFENKSLKIGSPALTVSGVRLSLNADAGDILRSIGAKFFHVLWDEEACKVALKPVARMDDSAYKISYPKEKRGASFSAQSFLNHIRWGADKPISVPVIWNEKEKLFEAVLPKQWIGTDAPPRKRSGA